LKWSDHNVPRCGSGFWRFDAAVVDWTRVLGDPDVLRRSADHDDRSSIHSRRPCRAAGVDVTEMSTSSISQCSCRRLSRERKNFDGGIDVRGELMTCYRWCQWWLWWC